MNRTDREEYKQLIQGFDSSLLLAELRDLVYLMSGKDHLELMQMQTKEKQKYDLILHEIRERLER